MKDNWVKPIAAILCGGCAAVWLSQEVSIFILAFFVLLFIRLYFFWKPDDFYGRISKPEIILIASGIITGFLYGIPADRYIAEPLSLKDIEAEGKLIQWQNDGNAFNGIFVLEKITAEGADLTRKDTAKSKVSDFAGKKYMLKVYPAYDGTWPERWYKVEPGDILRIRGNLEQPQPPGTAGEFDFPLYNAVRGLNGSITAYDEVMIIAEGKPPLTWLIRQKVRGILDPYWPEQAGILEGILFGDDSRIPAATMDMYKAAGVMHVFAASGANVAFVLALGWKIFFFLPRKLRILTTMAVILLYAALCQGNPPILRATVLGMAVLFGMFGNGKIAVLRWLFIAALVLFLVNPLYLRDISFLLSFAAAWGMIVIAPRLQRISWMRKLPQSLQMSLAVTLAAQVATLPILVDVFHRISLIGLITNVFVLFGLGAVLQLGLMGTVLLWLPVIPLVFYQTACWLLQITDIILRFCASLPFAYFWVLNPGWLFWLMWYITLSAILIGKEKVLFIVKVQLRKIKRCIIPCGLVVLFEKLKLKEGNRKNFYNWLNLIGKRKKNLAPAILLVLIILLTSVEGKDRLVVTFLDVGQGDCILLETKTEKLLVDTGPRNQRFDAGERVLVPYLVEKRIGSLDMLFLTHEDNDHVGGAQYLLANIPVDTVAVPEVGERLNTADWLEWVPLKTLADRGKLIRLKAGDQITFGSGLVIEVLAPTEVLSGTQSDSNNNSLVLLLTYYGKKILLTGDMECEQMQRIEARGAKWEANFIKIPHHGSAGSLDPDWFDQTNPQAVFVQAGKNSFGHPSYEVLRYWQERGVPVYRTDRHGTVCLIIDKDGCTVVPGRKE